MRDPTDGSRRLATGGLPSSTPAFGRPPVFVRHGAHRDRRQIEAQPTHAQDLRELGGEQKQVPRSVISSTSGRSHSNTARGSSRLEPGANKAAPVHKPPTRGHPPHPAPQVHEGLLSLE